ncbi:DinB family protein [Bacillus sp. 03113]|uniref:DinB family protein n=1 Tax=Bacillus sp. 03113 TaxID=2578211 RepID=UPI0011426A89|nr:DinB family protein [Bacillus sp. 03113]
MPVKPLNNEYPSMYHPYITLVPEGNLISLLTKQSEQLSEMLLDVPEEKWTYRYAADKWSLKEVIGHILDNEIIMNYRLFRISRGDTTSLPGYEQDDYIKASNYHTYKPSELIDDYKTIRCSTLATIRGVNEDAWIKQGYIDNNVISARALGYIIAGHELHHVKVIKEKYLF